MPIPSNIFKACLAEGSPYLAEDGNSLGLQSGVPWTAELTIVNDILPERLL